MGQYNVLKQKDLLRDERFLEICARNEGAYLVKPSDFEQETLERLRGDGEFFGDTLPWSKTHRNFRLRPGEATLWTGITGHGKSLLTSHVGVHLAQSRVIAIASLEMPVSATNARMIRQLAGYKKPTEEWTKKALKWLDRSLWIYDQQDTVDPCSILGLCRNVDAA